MDCLGKYNKVEDCKGFINWNLEIFGVRKRRECMEESVYSTL